MSKKRSFTVTKFKNRLERDKTVYNKLEVFDTIPTAEYAALRGIIQYVKRLGGQVYNLYSLVDYEVKYKPSFNVDPNNPTDPNNPSNPNTPDIKTSYAFLQAPKVTPPPPPVVPPKPDDGVSYAYLSSPAKKGTSYTYLQSP